MKKEYEKPMAEMIDFVPDDDIMDDVDIGDDDWNGGSSLEDW